MQNQSVKRGSYMRIAICDDMDILLNNLYEKICMYFSDNSLEAEIEKFHSGEEVLEVFEKGKYDAIILDVDMGVGRLNGLETARQIRKVDPYIIIAFHTSYASIRPWEYGIDDYVHIVKNSPDEIYHSNFKELHYKYRQNAGFLDSKLGNCYLKDILYIDLEKDRLIIHTVEGIHIMMGNIDVNSFASFAKINDKQYVNQAYIKASDSDYVTLTDETQIPYKKKKSFFSFLFNRGDNK